MIAVAAAAVMVAVLATRKPAPSPGAPPSTPPAPPAMPARVFSTALSDDFGATLDASRWAPMSEADFEEKVVDTKDGRLRFRCATRGTDDRTVKFFGVRSVPAFRFGKELRVSAELDWNNQANGSYLSAGIVLAPERVNGNPLITKDFLRVEYIGVPPGKNGRIVVVTRNAGREQYLHTEGWPEKQREGRKLGVQKVEIVIRGGAFEVFENGASIYQSKEKALAFDSAHLYLQMSSHSNYPPRELFFDNVQVRAAE
jgi:hypothetical protein